MTTYKDIINQDSPLWYFPLQETSGVVLYEANNKSSATANNLSYGALLDNRVLFNGVTLNGSSSYIQLPLLQYAQNQYWTNTKLLLHANGVNGSTVFTDSSALNNTVTYSGDAKISTTNSKFGGSSIEFSGAGMITTSNAEFALGTGDFTIEFFLTVKSVLGGYNSMFDLRASDGDTLGFDIGYSPSGQLFVYCGGFVISGSSVTSATTNLHIALVRQSTSIKMYVEGVQSGATWTTSNNFTNSIIRLGIANTGANPMNGFLDELVVLKGYAKYTSTFTPPTSEWGQYTYTAGDFTEFSLSFWMTPQISANNNYIIKHGKSFYVNVDSSSSKIGCVINDSTAFLSSFSNPIVDNSINKLAITQYGQASISYDILNPFGSNTGNLKLSSVSDYVSIPYNSDLTFSSDFTIDLWLYRTAVRESGYFDAIFCSNTSPVGIAIAINSIGRIGISVSSAGTWDVRKGADPGDPYGSVTIPLNTWAFVRLYRTGSSWVCLVNGSLDQTFTSSLVPSIATNGYNIGHWHDGWQRNLIGYISNFRIVSGVAITDTTVPSKPSELYSGTNLSTTLTPSKLYHAVITYSNSYIKLFLNGVLCLSGSTASILSSSDNWLLGKFYGILSQFAVFDYELTQSKIQNHYWNGLSNLDASDPILDPYLNKVVLSTRCEQPIINGDPYKQNTCLLMHFNGDNNSANFVDETGKIIVPMNYAYLSSTQKKFGTSSGYFANDSKLIVNHSDFNFGINDFTIEFFIYLPIVVASGKWANIFDFRTIGNTLNGLYCYISSDMKLRISSNGTEFVSNNTLSSSTWYHIVICRDSGTISIFNNGLLDVSSYMNTYLSNTVLTIGCSYINQATISSPVYIDELRITRLLSRYRYNFDLLVPTIEYPNTQDTLFDSYSGYAVLDLDFNPKNNIYSFFDNVRNATITANGNAVLSSSQKKTGETSVYFDGNGDYLELSSISDYNLFSYDFTIELDVYLSGYANNISGIYSSVLLAKDSTGNREYTLFISGTSNSFTGISFYGYSSNSVYQNIDGVFNFALNTWYNIAVSRKGNDLFIFVDGNVVNSVSMFTIAMNNTPSPLRIGGNNENYNHYLNGYIDNLRISKGVSKYYKTYTCTVLNKVYSQLLLEKNSNVLTFSNQRYISNRYKKYGNSSIKFTNSWMNVSSSRFTIAADFTIDMWCYFNTVNQTNGASVIISSDTLDRFQFAINGNNLSLWIYSSMIINYPITASTLLNSWIHFSIVRSGNVVYLFMNGVMVSYGTYSGQISISTLYFGYQYRTSTPSYHYVDGYMDDIRFTNGVARYTNNFTLPDRQYPDSQLYTHSAKEYDDVFDNVSLLLHGDTLVDSSKDNTSLTSYGGLSLTTERSKFFNTSLKATNTSDYLITGINNRFSFNVGDFTVELWCFPTSLSGNGFLIDGRPSSTNGDYLTMYLPDSIGSIGLYVNSSNILTSNQQITLMAWNHIAIVRKNNITTLFINGVPDKSCIDTTPYIQNRFIVFGQAFSTGISQGFLGFIEELRVTSGVARYSGTFELPKKAYPDSSSLNWTPFTQRVIDSNNVVMGFPANWNSLGVIDPNNIVISFAKYRITGKAMKDDYSAASFVSIQSVDGVEYYTQTPDSNGNYEFINLNYKQYYITADAGGLSSPKSFGPIYPDLIM